MKWIFEECLDTYGFCIRQYIVFTLSFLIFLIAIYSLIKLRQKQQHMRFEFIPLTINAISTLGILVMTSQQQQQSVMLLQFIIQIYSYSLLVYAYAKIYLASISKISVEMLKKVRIIFIVFSLVMLALLIGTAIYSWVQQLTCKSGEITYWYVGLTCIELPIFISAFFFIYKTKSKIKQIQQNKQTVEDGEQLLLGDDAYIKIKYKQSNLALGSVTLSIIIHGVSLILLLINPFECNQKSYFIVAYLDQLVVLVLIDFGDLLPHLLLPLMFYFVPMHYEGRGKTVFLPAPGSVKQQESAIYSNFYAYEETRNKD